jgi:hypothetical protein
MLEEAKQGREEAFAQSLARKQRLYTRASVAKQLKTALAVQNAIDRMYGDFAHEQEGDMNAVDRFLAALKEGETSPEGR